MAKLPHFPCSRPCRTPLRLAAAACATLLSGLAAAQTTTLETVTVTGKVVTAIGIGGFGDVPLARSPFQASVISAEQLRERGVSRLSDVTKVDASVSDAYNTEGYWDYLTLRGFVIDNRFNYRRDGLPISAETAIPLDNKDRIEILKGLSGTQAGTSAPGGLVNLVVKRPTAGQQRDARLEWRQPGSVLGAVDLSQRFGAADAFGLRLNVAAERLSPAIRDARGERTLLALAGEWRLRPDALLEAEFESSHRSQPSVPGFSLLGDRVPAPGDPRINLNNQPWSLPVVLDGNTASLRYTHKLNADWQVSAHGATQLLESQDRIAFPFGCLDASAPPAGRYYPDRYCPNGSYDLYDFRSESEHRRTDSLELATRGRFNAAGAAHEFSAGLLQTRVRNRFREQAYNYVGTGNVDGTLVTPADPTLSDQSTQRNERSTEFFVRDALRFNERLTAWLGLRHTRLHRESVRTDGSRPTSYDQAFTAPWLAASWAFSAETFAYASWGRGTESDVVPNRRRYINAGEATTAQSRQGELGVKFTSGDMSAGLAYFDIQRQAYADRPREPGGCDSDTATGGCVRTADGQQRHRGIEAQASRRDGPWLWQGGLQWLHARRTGSADPAIDGQRPTNVPAASLHVRASHDVGALPGLTLTAQWSAGSSRMVLEDNSVSIPGYALLSAQIRYAPRSTGAGLVWRAGIDNLLDRRAWRESPLQFSHAYLFPLTPRTLRFSVEASL